MRRARDLGLAALLLAACGAAGTPGPAASPSPTVAVNERVVAFTDGGTTTQGPRRVEDPGIEAVRAGTGLRITAYQGEQRSGGYAIRIERITRVGNELRVHARFISPAPDSMNTMALTYPSHMVTVDEIAGVVVLIDTTGTERARIRIP